MRLTISRVTSLGAAAPGTSTAPITRSAWMTDRSMASTVENSVVSLAPKTSSSSRRRSMERSITVTLASMPTAMRAAWVPETPPPMITTRAGATPGTPPRRMPAPPLRLFQAMGADLDRHAARDLAHGRQQRQAAARARHRLIGDGGAAGVDQPLGLLGIGRQMQIGEEELALAQHLAFDGLRLLHLHDHIGLGEDIGRRLGDGSTRALIGMVVEADARPGMGLDHDLMAIVDQLPHARRHQADAILVSLDLLWHADQHDHLPSRKTAGPPGTAGRCSDSSRRGQSTFFSTSPRMPKISSICFFSQISGGERAMMSPVTRTRRSDS